MSCFHKADNTDTLRGLIASGFIAVDIEKGTVARADGKPFTHDVNFGGYSRFRVWVPSGQKGVKGHEHWVFVHKAVVLAMGLEIPEGHQIDHINRDNADNRGLNLRLVTPSQNLENRTITKADYGPPAF